MSAVLGPTFGAATDAFLSLKGGSELLTETLTGEDDGSNAEERIFAEHCYVEYPLLVALDLSPKVGQTLLVERLRKWIKYKYR